MGLQLTSSMCPNNKESLSVPSISSPLEYYFQREQDVFQRTRPCLLLAEL